MATKTIVRYTPPNPIVGRRELSPQDFKDNGIFTQKKPLAWNAETGFWIDADEAKISPEALAWLEGQKGEFTVERQELPDEEDELADAGDAPSPREGAPVEGEQPTGAGTPGATGTTTSTSGTARTSRAG